MSKTVAVIKEAKRKIVGGWTKGSMYTMRLSGNYAYCAIGAVELAAAELNASEAVLHRAVSRLRKAAKLPLKRHASSRSMVISWNDASKTRKKHVVKAFEKAARL